MTPESNSQGLANFVSSSSLRRGVKGAGSKAELKASSKTTVPFELDPKLLDRVD